MYHRFLNKTDYYGTITEDALEQLIRGNEGCLAQAEETAESSVLEYLTENYEVEKALMVGKNIQDYNKQITYPARAYFYKDGKMWETTRTINGHKSPSNKIYWEEFTDAVDIEVLPYSQLQSYNPGDIVSFANTYYTCVEYNGIDFDNVRIPGLMGWETVSVYSWEANLEYDEWEAVSWNGEFYALTSKEGVDLTINPELSNNWGLIGEYDPDYNKYAFSDTEYVVFDGHVYVPTMEVNADEVKEGYNIKKSDPRNSNLKKHILRMSVYELHKLISPNNVSLIRITDYEASLQWLRDASKLRINPQIQRKLDTDSKPVTDWQISTFQRDYDPYKNPWQI